MRDNARAFDISLDAQDHARLRRHMDAAPGPGGDVFALERDRRARTGAS